MRQRGFIPVILLIGILLAGLSAVLLTKTLTDPDFIINTLIKKIANLEPTISSPSPSEEPSQTSTPSPTNTLPSTTLTPTATKKPTATATKTPTLKPTATTTATPTQTQTPTAATATPTQYYSREAPVLSVSGPYTIGESGPCFDLSSKHPYLYSQAADYRFAETESYRYTTLRLEGNTHVGTVCWVKDGSKTGKQYVFSAQAYTSATPEKIYSNQVNLTYTHP